MKWVVRGVLLVIILGFLSLAAGATLLATFDPNDYKGVIAAEVKKATGREMAFNGDIRARFFPVLGFEAADVTLGNPAGFDEKSFLSVGQIQAGVKILPLLDKKIELTTVSLIRPDITIIKKADGTMNTAFTTSAPSGDAAAPRQDFDFSLEGLEVQDAKLTSIDKKGGKTTVITPFNLTLPGFAPGKDTSISMDMTVLSGESGATKITASGKMRVAPGGKTVTVSGFSSDITLTGITPLSLSVAGNVAIDTQKETIALTGLNIGGKGTSLTGQASIKGFSRPDVAFDLTSPAIDLDALMPADRSSAAKDDGKQLLPVDALRTLALKGQIKIGTLKSAGLTMGDVSASLSARDGLITVSPVTMTFYGGTITTRITIDARNASPAIKADGKVENVQVASLLRDKMGQDYLSGLGNVGFDVNSTGNSAAALRSSAGGSVTFKFSDGYINKWDLSKLINQAIAYFETGKIDPNASDKIYFTSLDGVFAGSNGVFRNENLVLKAPKSHALGSGTVSLRDQSVDYTLRVGLGDSDESMTSGRHIPVRMTGPFSNPQYAIDVQAMVMDAAGEKIEKKKEELLNKAFEKLQGRKAEPQAADGTATPSDTAPAAGDVVTPAPETPAPEQREEDPARQLLKGLMGGG